MYPARLDEKGRLKLPEKFQRYLAGLPEKKLFVTSTERLMATVYPIGIWRENEKLLADFRDNPKASKRLWFTAQDLGSEAEMDGQGRVQFSPELRRYLHIENQPVKVHVVRSEGHTSELQSPCNIVCRLLLEKKRRVTRAVDRVAMHRHGRRHTDDRMND